MGAGRSSQTFRFDVWGDLGCNWSRSKCSQVQLVTCCDLPGFHYRFKMYSMDFSILVVNCPEVFHFFLSFLNENVKKDKKVKTECIKNQRRRTYFKGRQAHWTHHTAT